MGASASGGSAPRAGARARLVLLGAGRAGGVGQRHQQPEHDLEEADDVRDADAAHAAVEHTFVQFYPTLKVMAKSFGTYNEAREQVTDAK